MTSESGDDRKRFVDEASRKPPSFAMELLAFLRHNKKWWLAPIVAVLLAMGVLILLSGTAAAPFIYPLF